MVITAKPRPGILVVIAIFHRFPLQFYEFKYALPFIAIGTSKVQLWKYTAQLAGISKAGSVRTVNIFHWFRRRFEQGGFSAKNTPKRPDKTFGFPKVGLVRNADVYFSSNQSSTAVNKTCIKNTTQDY